MSPASPSILAVVLVLASACAYEPVLDPCRIRCGARNACPENAECASDQYCQPRGAPPGMCAARRAAGAGGDATDDTLESSSPDANAANQAGPDVASPLDGSPDLAAPDARPFDGFPADRGLPGDSAGSADAPATPDTGIAVPDAAATPLDVAISEHDAALPSPDLAGPPAPSGLTAETGDRRVTLSWSTVPGALSYTLYFATRPGVVTDDLRVDDATPPYQHQGLTGGIAYHYRIAARTAAGEGELSQEVTATPMGAPPSCLDLPATCGPNESCCTSPSLPRGTFNRCSDPAYPATVSPFLLDKYEVILGRFRKFVDAGQGTQASPPAAGAGAHPRVAASGWNSDWNVDLPLSTAALRERLQVGWAVIWTDMPGANENRPMNNLTWFLAFAFCAWDGGRLATEAEWNYAAAGGAEHRQYAWGDGIDPSHANYACMADGIGTCSVADVLDVGARVQGNGRWGHADLIGNIFEWGLDWSGMFQVPCNDCAKLGNGAGGGRTMRGGGAFQTIGYASTINRYGGHPQGAGADSGVRCARDR